MDKIAYDNLRDAGCDDNLIRQFSEFEKNGDVKGQLRLLSGYKEKLLQVYHEEQKKIDCLDFLMFNLQQVLNQENIYEKK